jgi:putative spermidine/putrescine transport system permease protein
MRIYGPGVIAVLMTLLAIAFLLAPLLAVVPISFTPFRFLQMPEGEYSLRHYRTILESPAWHASIFLSARIAFISSLIATALATAFGLGIWYARSRLTPIIVGFVMLPLVVPPVVSAVTLYFFTTWLSRQYEPIGYDTLPGVALAHIVMIVPFAVVVILVALSQLDRRIEMAARGMGASLWQTSVMVVLPNIRFGMFSAWLLTFVLSWEEIAVTLFITSVQAVTLPRRIWMGLRDNIDPAVAAISVILIVVTVVLILIRVIWREMAERGTRRRGGIF